MNKDSLERYDSKRAAELKAYIDERERMLDEQKGDRKEMIKLATTALENGATMDIVNKMLNSKTIEEALLYSGTSLQKPDKTKAGTPDISLTPEDRRTLIGAGLTSAAIKQIESDIQQYGLNAVLEGVDDAAQKAAIQKIFNQTQKVSMEQVKKQVTQKVAEDGLKEIYTDAELKKLADEAGISSWFSGEAADIKNYLASQEAVDHYAEVLYKRYKDAGMAI